MNNEAFEIFQLASQGFCCTQIMLKRALEEEGKENPDLIRAMNGLCGGIGYSGKTCGILTGAIGILGLYAGKGVPEETKTEDFIEMNIELMNWFEKEFGTTECSGILGYNIGTKGGMALEDFFEKCGDILINTYNKVREVLEENHYGFGDRE